MITDGVQLTNADIEATQVLEHAAKADLGQVLVIGTARDGKPYYASSTSDVEANLALTAAFDVFIKDAAAKIVSGA